MRGRSNLTRQTANLNARPSFSKRAGIAAAPSDAAAEVRSRVDYVTKARGGQGAVRELIEWLLRAQGRWQPIVAEWSSQGSR